jgi:hypothetical protein
MGELEIWRLRRLFQAKLPNASIRDFHDIVLLQGSLPLLVIEEILLEYIEEQLKGKARALSDKPPNKKLVPTTANAAASSAAAGGNHDKAVLWGVGVGVAISLAVALVLKGKGRS